jgi:ABC-type multidrug transport system fused ATPase/permease subunit
LLSKKYACKHYILLTVGILACALQGSILPIYGALMSKLLFVLNHPNQIPFQIETSSDPNINIKNGYEQNVKLVKYDKRGEANKFCLYMLYAAILAMVSSFFKRYFFGLVGERVTYRLRVDLFKKIISHGKGWFDLY